MNDCPNADVRDLLPDLVHDRLDASARRAVEAHVAQCADCADELALLRDLRAVRRTPKVDVAAIVAAVPAYRAAPRRSWIGWRAAAVITVLVAGASSVAVMQRNVRPALRENTHVAALPVPAASPRVSPVAPPQVVASAPVPEVSRASQAESPAPSRTIAAAPTTAQKVPERELAMGGGALGDLDDRQLASLLKDIESLDAVPSVEVESTPVSPIGPSSSGSAAP